MDKAERSRAKAEHIFTRTILTDLMVHQCMEADDPIAAANERAGYKLAAGDALLERKADLTAHLFLEQMETFWEGVRREVEARVRDRETRAQN